MVNMQSKRLEVLGSTWDLNVILFSPRLKGSLRKKEQEKNEKVRKGE